MKVLEENIAEYFWKFEKLFLSMTRNQEMIKIDRFSSISI